MEDDEVLVAEDKAFYKIVVIGNSGVGKSSLLLRFVDTTFSDDHITTIGVDFKIRTIQVDGKPVKLQIWDTAGQEKFRTVTATYYRATHGILVVYDITDPESFQDCQSTWLDEVNRYAPSNCIKVIVGNKCDLEDKRQIDKLQGKEVATQLGFEFFETSAKTSENVDTCFTALAKAIKDKIETLQKNASPSPAVKVTASKSPKLDRKKKNNKCNI